MLLAFSILKPPDILVRARCVALPFDYRRLLGRPSDWKWALAVRRRQTATLFQMGGRLDTVSAEASRTAETYD